MQDILTLAREKLTPDEFSECLSDTYDSLEDKERGHILRAQSGMASLPIKRGMGERTQREVVAVMGMWLDEQVGRK